VANPGGKNSPVHFNGLVQNPPVYGDKQKQGDLARTAPVAGAGATASALNAPRRAQRQASRGQKPQPTMIQAPLAQPQLSYPALLAQSWAEIAATPGASPLVQSLAQEAQLGSQS
jgi:hypothetical protein